MINFQGIKLSSDPESTLYVDGFSGGLNTLVSPQHIRDNECSILLNAQISEDGVIGRRSGSAQYDTTDGSRVFGEAIFTTYNASGVPTRNLIKVDDSGNLKKYNFGASTWTTLTGFTYTAGKQTEFAQNATNLWVVNGVDPLSQTDGSTITTYTSVSDPVGGLTVAQQGATGTSNYSYVYTLQTNTGETKPCATVSIANGNAKLDATNNVLLTITRSSDAHVTGYNVYGKTGTTLFFMAFVPQSSSGNVTFTDSGQTPNQGFAAPVANTTTGPVASLVTVYHDTLILAGDPAAPSMLRYTAGLDKFDSFQLVDGAGSILINPEDGDVITALVVFKNQLFIFKNRSIYMFSFGTGGSNPLATVSVVNPAIGCAAGRTAKVVQNDVYFLTPTGSVNTMGYQQGYYGVGIADLLRTNEVSIKIHPTLATINPARIPYATATYSVPNYAYVLAYADGSSTINNKVALYDTRYGAWVQWDNLNINCLINYIDSTGTEVVLYGDDSAGKIVQLFTGSSDQGTSFTFRMRTKDFNAGKFHLLKTWIWPTFHFRNIFGTITTTITADGTSTAYTNTITSTTSYTGWSYDRWAKARWGTTAGSSATASAADAPRQVNTRFDARSVMFLFENTSTSDSFTLLGVESRFITRLGRRLPGEFILN